MSNDLAFLYDSSKCTACKGCQVACKVWNNLPSPLGLNSYEKTGSYQAPSNVNGETRLIITFDELDNGLEWGVNWAFGRKSCQHCYNPACVSTCPASALQVDSETGLVSVHEENCIGCQFCSGACPFDIPKYRGIGTTVNKCTACLDRVKNGKQPTINDGDGTTQFQFNVPACVHTCPPGALKFGPRDEMIKMAQERVEHLKNREFLPCPDASVYGVDEMDGLHVIHVLKYGAKAHGLPENPGVNPLIDALDLLKPVSGIAAAGTVLGLGVAFAMGIGYKRDKLAYNTKTKETYKIETGEVVKVGDGQEKDGK